MTQVKPISIASCFHQSNLSGVIYSTTSRESFEGLRYWPIVRRSQPTFRKSFRTSSTPLSVSPKPSITDDLEGRRQDFKFHIGGLFADIVYTVAEVSCAAVGQVVAIDAGDN